MDNREKISVIVSIYNMERYLQRCVDSILAQTYDNMEILLVDDGSTDASGQICDDYTARDSRIRVIHQQNGGLSMARNAGLDQATADYCLFVDSDDELLPPMVETLWTVMCRTGADIVQCDYIDVFPESGVPEGVREQGFDPAKIGRVEVLKGNRKLRSLYDLYPRSVVQWNKLFRRQIFEDLRFVPGKCHEDEFIAHRELAAARSIAVIDSKLYLYYRLEGSITATPTMEKRIHACEGFCDRMHFFAEMNKVYLAEKSYLSFWVTAAMAFRKRDEFPDSSEHLPRLLELQREQVAWHRKYLLRRPVSGGVAFVRVRWGSAVNLAKSVFRGGR